MHSLDSFLGAMTQFCAVATTALLLSACAARPAAVPERASIANLRSPSDCRGACADLSGDECFAAVQQSVAESPPSLEDQVPLFRQLECACDTGSGDACASVGLSLFKFAGPDAAERATSLLKRACDLGSPLGCSTLLTLRPASAPLDHEESLWAFSKLRSGCDGDRRPAHCEALAAFLLRYEPAWVQHPARDGCTYAVRACELKQPKGCFYAGVCFEEARGVAQDRARAFSLYEQACEGGIAEGCQGLGIFYSVGDVVARDEGMAVSLYLQACSLGSLFGCVDGGNRLVEGRGVEKDVERGAALVEFACNQGDARGCWTLGMYYASNTLGAPDLARAVALYDTGCAEGIAYACFDKAIICSEELGRSPGSACASDQVEATKRRALFLAEQECTRGKNGRQCTLLLRIRQRLGPHISRAEAAALEARACELDPRECPGWKPRP